ncbi:putative AtrB glutamate-1-semialdehyde 2,1-aminomutase [Bradyrhizobium oligotrophicum S58]|uniref:Putative AtrB glutamate-1-semialdehyde 2,1-aminomutase n=1 Tax=Bradyrhizobium oligotrophicum S58 TaxID=1245469 RepID=M4Z2E5_9BRAD|nr:aspartate aminotransferase family protein [Bradyrhizobium oligotrophicum]BAM86932.1 putative AtrB glutamate-1-semialdehyde 2,1-aminomutase [Bradyrhizobium oligotrophicum S58]
MTGQSALPCSAIEKTSGARVGPRSSEAFRRARDVFPDGTTRVTIERDPTPRYVSHGAGAYVFDADGRRFLDLNANFTTLIHGHAFAPVVSALEQQLRDGTCFANPTEKEIDLAALICERVPAIERIRFCNTGTEAVMFAIKAARAWTGRPGIAKIEGAYHGAYDWVEVSQSSTPANWGSRDDPNAVTFYRGMPDSVLFDVVPLRFNDPQRATELIGRSADLLAAIVIDPMPSRAGLIAPDPEFVSAIQAAARRHGILIISDEVLNFRQGYAGAAARFGLEPDLYTLGKIIGGGLPIGAIGGRASVMAAFDAGQTRPAVPQGGTFSANPMSMTAGLVAMQHLDEAAFARLEQIGDLLRSRLMHAIERRQVAFSVTGAASLFRIHPKRLPPRDFREAFWSKSEAAVMTELTRFFTAEGIVLPNGAAACLSTPMGETEIDLIVQVFEHFLSDRAQRMEWGQP